MARLSKEHLQAWRLLFATHAVVGSHAERALTEAGLPGLADYDVLYRLYLAEGRALRMHQLADLVIISRSGLTRLADRLEQEGLITRRICPTDRRGLELVLQPAGIEMLRKQWRVYSQVIAELFAANVRDPAAVSNQLAPVVDALGITLPRD